MSLYNKYRPKTFKGVIGQNAAIRSLEKALEGDTQQFLFSGPSGTGKTTLARIAARTLPCEPHDILEISGAKYTGIDDMKRIMDGLACKPFGGGKFKAVVLDECHMLSKSAWNSLLKDVEEPPKHVYWFFCTTELAKVPKTIKTRCLAFDLKSVSEKDLAALVKYVADKEAIKLPADVSDMICTEAMGSPRQALVNLEACREAKDKKEAATLLKVALEGDSIRELCQFLLKGGSWMKCAGILAKLAEENPESIRIVVCNYMAAVIRNARSDKDACSTLSILQAFSTPYNAAEQMAPLYLSVGQVLFRSE